MKPLYTVVGARGFIGSQLTAELRRRGYSVNELRCEQPFSEPLGRVFYCSGLAAHANDSPFEAHLAHVFHVQRLLREGQYERLLYLSSTRVYDDAESTREEQALNIMPGVSGRAYVNSKIAGESAVLSAPRTTVARLSNVSGPSTRSPLFLSDIVRQAVTSGIVQVRTTRSSEKDYITINDVVRLLIDIINDGNEKIYNVARGVNTDNGSIFDALEQCSGAKVHIADGARTIVTPPIAAERIARFGGALTDVLEILPEMVEAFKRAATTPS